METKRIIYQNEANGVSILIPAAECGMTIEQIAEKDVPQGIPYEIVDVSVLPADRTFRDAWVKEGAQINHNLAKCKAIAHEMRRSARANEFAPLDIKATIPVEAEAAETIRKQVRNKYAAMQLRIDNASTVEDIKEALA